MRPLRATILAVAVSVLSSAACTSSNGDDGRIISPTPSGVQASGGSGAQASGASFVGHGVSFSYPAGWRGLRPPEPAASVGSPVWIETFAIDGRNLVSVARYDVEVSITDATIGTRAGQLRDQLANVVTQAGGTLDSGPTRLRMAGLPALGFDASVRTPAGRAVRSRLVLAFDGTTEYFVNCQYDPSGRDEIAAGCECIVSTFDVSAAGSQP